MAEHLLLLVASGFHGLIHVAGADCISKYDFGKRLAETFGLDESLIVPT